MSTTSVLISMLWSITLHITSNEENMCRKPVRHAWENNFAHLETKENKFRLESYEAMKSINLF